MASSPKIKFKEEKRKEDKRKRTVLTLSQKLDICRRLKAGVKKHVLMQEFNIGSSTIYDIRSREDEWLNIVADSEEAANRHNVRRPKMEKLETVLLEWFQLKKSEGERVTGPMLIEKAKDLYYQMNLNENCVFSGGWLTRFKNRHKITKIDLRSKSTKYKESNSIVDHRAEENSNRNSKETSIEQLNKLIKTEIESETEVAADQYAASWEAADLSFGNLISFAETFQCFSPRDIINLRRMYSMFLEKKSKHCIQ